MCCQMQVSYHVSINGAFTEISGLVAFGITTLPGQHRITWQGFAYATQRHFPSEIIVPDGGLKVKQYNVKNVQPNIHSSFIP